VTAVGTKGASQPRKSVSQEVEKSFTAEVRTTGDWDRITRKSFKSPDVGWTALGSTQPLGGRFESLMLPTSLGLDFDTSGHETRKFSQILTIRQSLLGYFE
jgi:hypothetical protein